MTPVAHPAPESRTGSPAPLHKPGTAAPAVCTAPPQADPRRENRPCPRSRARTQQSPVPPRLHMTSPPGSPAAQKCEKRTPATRHHYQDHPSQPRAPPLSQQHLAPTSPGSRHRREPFRPAGVTPGQSPRVAPPSQARKGGRWQQSHPFQLRVRQRPPSTAMSLDGEEKVFDADPHARRSSGRRPVSGLKSRNRRLRTRSANEFANDPLRDGGRPGIQETVSAPVSLVSETRRDAGDGGGDVCATTPAATTSAPRTTKAKPRSNQLLAQTIDGFFVGSNPVTVMKMPPTLIKAPPAVQSAAVCLSATPGILPGPGV